MIVICDDFKAPFGIPGLRLDKVNRWGIVSMTRQQTVAEHSFNVAIITRHVAHAMQLEDSEICELMIEALYHDIKEEYTGDIPSPAKVRNANERTVTIVKLADTIESYRFAMQYCNDSPKVKQWLTNGLLKSIIFDISILNIKYEIIQKLIEVE